MRTEAWWAVRDVFALAALAIGTATAGVARAEPGPWIVGVDGEASVIGESFGTRAEVAWRLGPAGTVSHLRAAIGVLPGPEFTFVPVSLGYRALWRADRTVQPFAGAGWENQHFVISNAPTEHRWLVLYVEGGCGFAVAPQVTLGLATSLDWSFVRDQGAGLQLRGTVSYRL